VEDTLEDVFNFIKRASLMGNIKSSVMSRSIPSNLSDHLKKYSSMEKDQTILEGKNFYNFGMHVKP
jgi:hypothetical protein